MGLAGAESCCAFYNRKESNRIKDNASDFGHKRGSSQELQMSFVVLRKCEAGVFTRASSIRTEGVGKSPLDTMSLRHSMLNGTVRPEELN
jgi:hypothetical protein